MEKCKLQMSAISKVNKNHTELPNLLSEKVPYFWQFLKWPSVLYNISAENHFLPKLSCRATSATTFQPCAWIAPRGTGHSHQHTGSSYNPCELWACSQVVAVSLGRWVPELVCILLPFHTCIALCAVPALGCNHQVVTHLSEKVWSDGIVQPHPKCQMK